MSGTTTGGSGGGSGGAGDGGVAHPVGVACSDAPPWTTTGTPAVNLAVDAGSPGQPWSRYYEKAVSTDHAGTILTTAWGRNIQAALKKGHDQAGFQYARFHGVLDDDIGVYTEDSGGNAVYTWTRFDQVYDAIVAAGMRAIIEISFMPAALAMDPSKKLVPQFWYNNMPPVIDAAKDWTKWEALMTAMVQHLEQKYGADEIRNHWYFEVWNEPSWMYVPGPPGYTTLYQHTVNGLVAADPQVKVGGPADTAGDEIYITPTLINFTRTNSLKLDFITYHRYGNDGATTPTLDAAGMRLFHHTMVDMLKSNNFTGQLFNTEFGSDYSPAVNRDNESSASFIAKTIHLIGTDTAAYPPPFSYSWWALSDLYEEINVGPATAYREGNYGLLLKGDPSIPESFDVAKPAFNAFRLLHMMGDTQIATTGGTTGDGVNATATLAADGHSAQILVYSHTNGASADPTQSSLVSLAVSNLPFTPTHVLHYVVDHTHANSYTSWVNMQKPARPTQAQWITLRDAAELCYYTATPSGKSTSWAATFPQNNYSVSLIILSG
jgi:xylan 1,4-beta-xylosidase